MGLCTLHHLVIQKVVFVPSVEIRLMVIIVDIAPQEPIVFNLKPCENSSQSPPQIDHQCCYECGDPLDDVFCRRCTCESCRNSAHIGYNCPPKVLVVSNLEPYHNQNVDELPQTLTNFHPTSYTGDENSSAYDSTPNFVNDSPNVFHPPPQTTTNSYEFCENDAHYSYDCPPQAPCEGPHENFQCQQVIFYEPCCGNYGGLHETFQCQPMKYYETTLYESNYSGFDQFQPPQPPVIHQPPQETSIKILHDHENAINSVQTFLRKSDRFSFFKTPKVLLLACDRVSEIKNAVGNKQYKPEDVQELFHKLLNDVQNIHEELAEYINIPSWNHPTFSSHDDDNDANYTIPITPEEPDNSLSMRDEHLDTIPATNRTNLEEVKDNNLREKIMNINLLIAKIKSLNDNPTPDHGLKSPIDSFLEKSDTSLSYSDNSLPEFETFSNHTEETNSDSTTTHADYSLSKYDSFLFEIEPDQGKLTSVVILVEPRVHVPNVLTTHPTLMMDSYFIPSDLEPGELTSTVDSGIRKNVLSATNVNLPPEDDHSSLFAYVSLRLFGRVMFLVDVLCGGGYGGVDWFGDMIDVALEFVDECMVVGSDKDVLAVVRVFG
nr:hypothetical protein [Tanacetum cinerariifolium]